ncbi:MAG TPA: DUF2007 domain-containing protein [Smithellaceae bacterium]|nr:DUF2007 domain-containing protein [Smithellaceae bacterium]HQI24673.1 DUF2007 domain-containing protein [Smithella sp.]HRS90316.1 DUF2007 domain-containing protein [Smithellaceae bacterium]HRV27043.1 DUF2007 domain-containing protein [Smithellaceae bacterium]
MFCPKCKGEYREGFYKCADCDVYLVGELPQASTRESDDEFVEVFSTYNQGEIAFIKSVLDGEGITYFFQGEGTTMLIAAGAYARLLVKADEAKTAREILRDLGFL